MSLDEKYKQFVALKQYGPKHQVRMLAEDLIREYQAEPDEAFLLRMCDACTHKMDHMLWKRLVFPAMERRLDDDPKVVRALIKTVQNLYSDKEAWQRLGFITEMQLTQRLLELCPEDGWARQAKAAQLHRWLAYTIHEWPGGVLYGADGASMSECDEILSAVEELLRLDESGRSIALCQDVREKTLQYKKRLASSAG
jgi:hypothetical protein